MFWSVNVGYYMYVHVSKCVELKIGLKFSSYMPGCIPCTKVRRSPAWSCTIPVITAYYCHKIGYFDMGCSPPK